MLSPRFVRLPARVLLGSLCLLLLSSAAGARRRTETKPIGTGTLVGIVIRPAGEPGPTADLMASPKNGSRVESTTARDGTFRLADLPAGPLKLKVTCKGYWGRTIRLDVRAGAVDSIYVSLDPITNNTAAPPCPSPDRADPDCIASSPEEEARVGTPCPAHPGTRLALDVVSVHYGYLPHGSSDDSRMPNARLWVSAGCVIGRPFAEVAYCERCRALFASEHPGWKAER